MITVDTEADSMWDRPATYTFRNTRGLERLQGFVEDRGFVPTYLVTYEVASDPESAALLARLGREGRAEIGAHLHPWSTPPFERVCDDEDRVHPFPHDYSATVFERKMATLGSRIEERLETVPRSYRAGRWGFVGGHAPILRSLGYDVDTSVTPGVSWSAMAGRPGGVGGASFLGAPRVPYRLSASDAAREGSGGLWEVPVSIEWNRSLPRPFEDWVDRAVAFRPLLRALRKSRMLRAVWLRPYPRFSERDLDRLCDRLSRRRRPVWNLMFHSSEATAGTSPYSPGEGDLAAFYAKLDRVLQRARRAGVRPATLSSFVRALPSAPSPSS